MKPIGDYDAIDAQLAKTCAQLIADIPVEGAIVIVIQKIDQQNGSVSFRSSMPLDNAESAKILREIAYRLENDENELQ